MTRGCDTNGATKPGRLIVVLARLESRVPTIATVAVAVVLVLLASMVVRTAAGVGPNDDMELGGVAVLAFIAAPSMAAIAVTRRSPIVCLVECALAFLAWAPLGVVGDFSCVDCGLAIMIPIALAVPQLALAAIAAAIRYRRSRS